MVLVGTFPSEYTEDGALLAISPRGQLVAWAKATTLKVIATSKPQKPLRVCDIPAEQGSITSLAWISLSDGTCCLIYGTMDGALCFVDMESIFHVVVLHHAPIIAMKARTNSAVLFSQV